MIVMDLPWPSADLSPNGGTKRKFWSAREEEMLAAAYGRAGQSGFVGLKQLAEELGRDEANVCRKARQLGLSVDRKRARVAERKAYPEKLAPDEVRARISECAKERFARGEHPRGMAGKKHTDATKQKIAQASAERWAHMTQEQKEDQATKAALTRIKNGTPVNQTRRGTWKAGWREIGGKRNYYRSLWEANYGRYLEWLKENGQISEWKHEPETFWFEAIKRGTRSYKPDFRVWENDGTSKLYEVKGWMDSRSRTCLSRMAKYYPEETIIVVDERQYKSIRKKVMGLISGWEDSARDARL